MANRSSDSQSSSNLAKKRELGWLRQIAGELNTQTVKRLDERLPWYRRMPPGRRSAVGLVAQSGIASFIQWYEDPSATPWIASDVFQAAPRELLRSISLQETLQLIRVVVSVVEDRVAPRSEELREAVLHYSRDVAFAAADVYARAAEARGLWDARLEALVVDSILTGEADEELPSRIAALGWHGEGDVAVLVGSADPNVDVDLMRRTARRAGADMLIGLQGNRLVLVLGFVASEAAGADDEEHAGERDKPDETPSFMDIAKQLSPMFAPGPIVLGPTVPSLVEAATSARAALAGVSVAVAWRGAPRPVDADALLPERAMGGDGLARRTLIAQIYEPLSKQPPEVMYTLWRFLDNGRSLEATARELIVHPNTVRYRLRKVTDLLGWSPLVPRDSLVLQTALIVGSIGKPVRPAGVRLRGVRAPRP